MYQRVGEQLLVLLMLGASAFGLVLVVLGITTDWWSSGSNPQASLVPLETSTVLAEPGLDVGPGVSSGQAGTATPEVTTVREASPAPEPAGTGQSTPTPPPADTPAAVPTATNTPPSPTPAPPEPPAAPADFAGTWRVVDTVTDGPNTGNTYTFNVTLTQNGDSITGGNSGMLISGSVGGDTASVEYTQPALGYQGTFTWTLVAQDRAEGTFTSSYPNSGTSLLLRLP